MGRKLLIMPPYQPVEYHGDMNREIERRSDMYRDMDMRSAPYRGTGGYNDRAGVMNYGGDMRMGGYEMRYDEPVYDAYDGRMRPRMTYPSMGGHEPEMRRERDSRGRYTSVRSEYGNTRMDDRDDMTAGYPYVPPVYERRERTEPRMNKIGFAISGDMERLPEVRHDYPNDASYMPMDEMSSRTGERMSGHADGKESVPMTKETAMEWASMLENADGTKGPHWTMEQVKQVMAQRQIQCDPVEFFLALNLTYSDLCKEFRKFGINNMDAYVDFAKAFWLNDKDVPDKLSRYYEMVVS